MNTKQFIERANRIHNNKYDYSFTEYIGTRNEVTIICPTHGEFKQKPNYHLLGSGCRECNKHNKNMGIEKFVQRAKEVHGDKYDYSKSDYSGADDRLIIICPEHGEFTQTPSKHLMGRGCRKCAAIKQAKQYSLTQQQFVDKVNKIHNNKYDYSKFVYINGETKSIIICPEHGEFEQYANNHLQGKGCPKCSGNVPWTTEEAINKAKKIHGERYDYSKFQYLGSHEKTTIICPTHGEFEQSPRGHINQHQGCPSCNESHGERVIAKWLDEQGIKYKRQKRWSDCKYKNVLPFDFYLPEVSIAIEYDGEQHFISKEYWGGDESFALIKLKDEIKTKYCLDNNIPLVRITYLDNIEERLKTIFDMKI